jgi:hypothetical protein
MVLQYNKRDLPNALPIEILNERMNPNGLPFYEAVAIRGQGVEETLKGATAMVFRSLSSKYGGADAAPSASPAPEAAAPPAPVLRPPRPTADTPVPLPAPPVAPPPDTAPQPRKPGSATLPPFAKAKAPPPVEEDLLESIELHPEVEEQELSFEAITTDPAAGVDADEEVIDADDLAGLGESQEFPLEEPAVPTSTLPPPKRPDNRTTLVSEPDEAAELRARIRAPREPELQLDEIEDEEEIESISLDEPAPRAPTVPAPAPPAPQPQPARAAAAAAVPSSPASITTAPISVELTAVPGRTDVSIPVELHLRNGSTARLVIHLNLTLNLDQD